MQAENSFGLARDFSQPDISFKDLRSTFALSHTFASANLTNPSIEKWFDNLPKATRNKLTFYTPADNDRATTSQDFIVTVSPIIGDMREAMLVTIVDDSKKLSLHSITNYSLHFIKQAANFKWLGKTIYFLVLRDGNARNSGVKRFIDWYNFDLGAPLRNQTEIPISRYRRRPLGRAGIIRQSVSLNLSDFEEGSTLSDGPVILVNKIGPRNANIDFISQSLITLRASVHGIEESIVKEINNNPQDLSLPHVYLNTLQIDSMTLTTGRVDVADASAAMNRLFHSAQQIMRGCNEMVLSFHHLSSQYWLDSNPIFGRRTMGAVTINNQLFPLISFVIALTSAAFTPSVVNDQKGADERLWLTRQEFFFPFVKGEGGGEGEGDQSIVEENEAKPAVSERNEEKRDLAIHEQPSLPSPTAPLNYKLLGDWASGYLAITSITAGAALIAWQVTDFFVRYSLLAKERSKLLTEDSVYYSFLIYMIFATFAVYAICFSVYDAVAYKYRHQSALVESAKHIIDIPIIARALSLPIQIYVFLLITLTPALGLLCAILVSIVWLGSPPFNLFCLLGLVACNRSFEFLKFWRFAKVLRFIQWSSLMRNTLRPYLFNLTDDDNLTAFTTLISLTCLMVLRAVLSFASERPWGERRSRRVRVGQDQPEESCDLRS